MASLIPTLYVQLVQHVVLPLLVLLLRQVLLLQIRQHFSPVQHALQRLGEEEGDEKRNDVESASSSTTRHNPAQTPQGSCKRRGGEGGSDQGSDGLRDVVHRLQLRQVVGALLGSGDIAHAPSGNFLEKWKRLEQGGLRIKQPGKRTKHDEQPNVLDEQLAARN